jgi:hypothetical protein
MYCCKPVTCNWNHKIFFLLFPVLRYKPEGSGFDSRWSTEHLTEMIIRNISWGVEATRADCFEIWEPEPPGTLSDCTEIALLYFHCNIHYTEKQFQLNKTMCRFF